MTALQCLLCTYLARDGESVTYLCFPSPKLAKDLGDGPGLDTSGKKSVQLFRTGCQLNDFRSLLVKLSRCREPHGYQF